MREISNFINFQYSGSDNLIFAVNLTNYINILQIT